MRNYRILIQDLIAAARALHEVKIVAAGSMYATLECDSPMLQKLSAAGIFWTED